MERLKGKIVSGLGDFSKRMEEIPGCRDAYERKTGMRFYPGTLNIQLADEWNIPKGAMRLDQREYGGTVSVSIVACSMLGRKAFILRTEKNEAGVGGHPKTIVEVACDVKLRETFNLHDGDKVEITVES